MFNVDPALRQKIQDIMKSGNNRAIAELIRGAIADKLRLEDWLTAAFDTVGGPEFSAPPEAKGRIAQKVVRGQKFESFKVAARKVVLTPERYVSKPSMDVGDLEDGNVANLADLIRLATLGLQEQILVDAYGILSASAKFGDDNFHLVIDDGSTLNTGAPAYIPKAKRKIDEALASVQDTTVTKQMNAIIVRKVLAADIILSGVISDINKSRFELDPMIVPGEYRGVPVVSLSGAKDVQGNIMFPSNEIYAIAQGAGSYALPKPLRINTREVEDLEASWEVWLEQILALWFQKQVHRIYVVDTVAGTKPVMLSNDANGLVLKFNKYIDPATVTATNIKVYTGADPGGAAGAAFTASYDVGGRVVNLDFTTPLTSGAYKVYTTTAVKDVGGTSVTATTHASPAATFTIA